MGLFGRKDGKPRVCAVCGAKLGLLELLLVELTDNVYGTAVEIYDLIEKCTGIRC